MCIQNLLLSPESTASIFSWCAFQWMNPLVVFGFRNIVTRENIYALTFQHLSRTVFEDFVNTKKMVAHTKIFKRIYKSNKVEVWWQFIFCTLACLVSYLGPYFQQKFLEYIELGQEQRPAIQVAYLYVIGMFTVGVVKLLCNNVQLWVGRRWNIRTLIMLDAEIFSKTLKRKDMSGKLVKSEEEESDTNKGEEKSFSNVGKITNLMSSDADHLSDIPAYIHMIYNSPVDIAVSIIYLYKLLGVSALVGLAIMILCFPISGYLTKVMSRNYTALNAAKDKRNDLVNELLQGIRMIKYFAWEDNWEKKIHEARHDEIKKLIKTIINNICNSFIFLAVPVLVTVGTFIWYTKVAGNELTASVAFVSITLFDMVRGPLIFLPETFTTLTEAYVSLKRISNYLEEPEVDENMNKEPIDFPEGVSPQTVLARVGFEKSIFQWHMNANDSKGTLKQQASLAATESTLDRASSQNEQMIFQLNVPRFNFPTGKLSLICGPTGSGKTSFLHALLGEMDIVSGCVYLPSKITLSGVENVSKIDPEYPNLYLDKVAYAAQQPFLRHASIRDNILFGLPYDSERYKKTLYQCDLIKDIAILPDGDRTEIGEKGISLSGGQKQRVSLARAVYSYAKTVLLDDCLSAVDAHTSKHIYEKCIMGDLLKGRTVILVTHQVRLCLPGAKFLVKIENGNVLGCDSIDNLKANGQLQMLIKDDIQENENDIEDMIDSDSITGIDLDLDNKKETTKLVKEETAEKGQVKSKVYFTYMAACGGWIFWIAILFAYVFARFLTFGENWWLRVWAAAYDQTNDISHITEQSASFMTLPNREPGIQEAFHSLGSIIQKQNVFRSWVFEEKSPVNVDYYIGIYVAICLANIIFDVVRNIMIFWGSIRGARMLFNSLLNRIIHAPMRFFDTTPIGRILNRFGKDISTIDMQIARSSNLLIECITGVVASTVVISIITPQFLVVAIIVSLLYFLIGVFYLRISRELKRLNSVSRSPIYSHFTETLLGITTIRAYGAEEQFMRTVHEKIDSFVAPFYLLWMSNRWLYARVEIAGSFVTLFTGIFLIFNIKYLDAGMAGISLFYARSFLENIYWFIRQYTSVEMDFNSVERVHEYLELEQEPPGQIENHRPPAAWPTTASIEVKDLVVRYAPELDPVLHGISFSTRAHEKIGIVGRTGSGKSTIALSFFRFLEACGGSISIDGIDISTIGVQDLRSKLTIIPQDAILFSGTIRSNLDPFEEHSDEEVWESLERVHLCKASDRLKGLSTPSTVSTANEQALSAITNLNQQVSDGGHNFSQGQRQLLCLARALLKNSKLIIMDEATASVDFDTDSKIQTTIREELKDSTLLCIAHRLRTVIDYDRILVLNQGQVIEFDTPYNLIVKDTGLFRSMCEQSGEIDVLLKMATEAHTSKMNEEDVSDDHTRVY
ncbi:P-loop containing nucleoside triphosphate hydrolase protein [Cokeromyces recurvatus]|uniref:P-loop containing nucleoside triphosphate hydrolase protein n=1 Tax=Cokeromyces recurvatus TaxID=90255 RepID=UPI00221FEA8E|nr:P-loop containing nucleoside triphosphate hydrolase protein [Cokeromyces recurvatus]KAI7902298.1 P-loop containing nucleoside triphosphate hydrolase protein [Cokeromyces recurvatus]